MANQNTQEKPKVIVAEVFDRPGHFEIFEGGELRGYLNQELVEAIYPEQEYDVEYVY